MVAGWDGVLRRCGRKFDHSTSDMAARAASDRFFKAAEKGDAFVHSRRYWQMRARRFRDICRWTQWRWHQCRNDWLHAGTGWTLDEIVAEIDRARFSAEKLPALGADPNRSWCPAGPRAASDLDGAVHRHVKSWHAIRHL